MDPLTYEPKRPTPAEQTAGLGLFAGDPPADPVPPAAPAPTSEAAAKAVAPRAGTIRRLVLTAIASRERGWTAEELEVQLGVQGNTLRPRLRELEELRYIERSATITRATTSGRQASVYFATPRGREALTEALDRRRTA